MPMSLDQARLPTSRFILGTAHLTDKVPVMPRSLRRGEAFMLLDQAMALGVCAVDTAPIYQLGGSERVIGDWLAQRNNRRQVYLISKGGHPSLPLCGRARLGGNELEHGLNRSLRRLRTDHLDLFLLHRDDVTKPIEPIAQALWSFVADGRVRAYGVSNWTYARFAELHSLATRHGMPPPAASSPQFSLPVWVTPPYPSFPGCVSVSGIAGASTRRAYRASHTAVLAWSPLGGGWLRPGGHRARSPAYGGRDNEERLHRATVVAQETGFTRAQVAIAYVLSHGPNLYPIVGTRRPERLAELVAALALTLDPNQLAYLDSGAPTGNPNE